MKFSWLSKRIHLTILHPLTGSSSEDAYLIPNLAYLWHSFFPPSFRILLPSIRKMSLVSEKNPISLDFFFTIFLSQITEAPVLQIWVALQGFSKVHTSLLALLPSRPETRGKRRNGVEHNELWFSGNDGSGCPNPSLSDSLTNMKGKLTTFLNSRYLCPFYH